MLKMPKFATRALFLSVLLSLPATGLSNARDGNYEVRLKARRYVPTEGLSDTVRLMAADADAQIQKAKAEKRKIPPTRRHVLIQLQQTPTRRQRSKLEAEGVMLLSYVPNKAWFATIDAEKAPKLVKLPNVRAITEILPVDKLSPHISTGTFIEQGVKNGRVDLIVQFFKDVSLDEAELVVYNHDAHVNGRVAPLNALVINVPKEQAVDLAFEETVMWVEQELPLGPMNNGVRIATRAESVNQAPYNLDGNDVNVLVYDAGPVLGTHPDFGDRVIFRENDPNGSLPHATHVAGIVGGDGNDSNGLYAGMAPKVKLLSYYVEYPCYADPNNLCLYNDSNQIADANDNFYEGVNTYGADVGTASVACQPARWKIDCSYEGDYSAFAQLTDTLVRDLEIPITWAAGNERVYETCGTTYSTICPSSTGKNVIVVGATNSNDDSMTTFSSWGPTDDGRIKPDLVAPGCQIGGDWGITSTWFSPNPCYASACGTSMATPAVAGCIALMVQDWRDNEPNEPYASTIKAILIQTTKELGSPGPDYTYGYGLVDVKAAVDLIEDDVNNPIYEDSITDSNDSDSFTVDVPEGTAELIATLVWTDYPGTANAEEALTNDLDLVVKDPNGDRYYPWTLDPCNPDNPADTNAEDHLNNVEQVYVYLPADGNWSVEVNGVSVPNAPQEYSLVISTNTAPGKTDGVFYLRNGLSDNVATWDHLGNLVLAGTLDENSPHTATDSNEFRIQDADGNDVAIVDQDSGNMYLSGSLYEEQITLTPGAADDDFIIKDADGNVLAYINDSGNLYLKGKLFDNAKP